MGKRKISLKPKNQRAPVTKTRYTLNDLPLFSPWPARLLGLEPWEPKLKTREEVIREYEGDKWGPLLSKVIALPDNITIEQVDDLLYREMQPTLCYVKNRLELLSPQEAHDHYVNMIIKVVESYLPQPAILELGAGYGSVILAMARSARLKNIQFFAGEYVNSGVELIKRIAKAQQTQITTGHCDLTSPDIIDFPIPAQAIIFTSMAVHYIPELSDHFVQALSALNPAVVVHIEPCFEHCQGNTLWELMRRRYIHLNDYNRNLVTVLITQQKRGMLKILEERVTIFGNNALLPVSIIAWVPTPKPELK
jgi:hypothetical protein